MEQLKIELRYDGTYPGLLTCFYACYQDGLHPLRIVSTRAKGRSMPHGPVRYIETNTDTARRVQAGLQNRLGESTALGVYQAFLSEAHEREALIYQHLCELFGTANVLPDAPANAALRVKNLGQLVARELQRIASEIEFEHISSGIAFAAIDPDFDILPLLSVELSSVAKRACLVFDTNRNYGAYILGTRVQEVLLHEAEEIVPGRLSAPVSPTEPEGIERLWQSYFGKPASYAPRQLKLRVKPGNSYPMHLTPSFLSAVG